MTTLAIIGGGIAGRSLLYALSSQHFKDVEILFFDSPAFATPCAFNSTAIVAPRGVSAGHSPLGDLILEGFATFREHCEVDRPTGVFPISQFTGALSKLDQFAKRYPGGKKVALLGEVKLKEEVFFAEEEAFMIDPALYLPWLTEEAEKKLSIRYIRDFVTGLDKETSTIMTQSKEKYSADHVIFATGSMSKHWKHLSAHPKLMSSKAIQGSYLEFSDIHWELPTFSITLEGCNLIYRKHSNKVLIGSSTDEFIHELAPIHDLRRIYDLLASILKLELPEFHSGEVKVGHREKAQKREPYLFTEGNVSFIGGLYKNGYSLSLRQSRSLVDQLRERV